jgi:hypothetical protein
MFLWFERDVWCLQALELRWVTCVYYTFCVWYVLVVWETRMVPASPGIAVDNICVCVVCVRECVCDVRVIEFEKQNAAIYLITCIHTHACTHMSVRGVWEWKMFSCIYLHTRVHTHTFVSSWSLRTRCSQDWRCRDCREFPCRASPSLSLSLKHSQDA